MAIPLPQIVVSYPDWVAAEIDWERTYRSVEDRMRLAIDVSRANIEHGTGGPFGAAIFEFESGRLAAVGMNLVVAYANSVLHAEMVAFMMAERRLSSFSLGGDGRTRYDLHASCDPCAMCLGATLWSGVCRAVSGADRDDARALGFDEGPVFAESYHYLADRGVEIVRGVLRREAARVLEQYRDSGGMIYNGR